MALLPYPGMTPSVAGKIKTPSLAESEEMPTPPAQSCRPQLLLDKVANPH